MENIYKKDFDLWTESKKKLDALEQVPLVLEREVWWCSLGVNVGSEQDGKNELFERPVLIIRKFTENLALIVPITTKNRYGDYFHQITHQENITTVLLLQVKAISTRRLLRMIYRMDDTIFMDICSKLRKLIPS